MKYKYQTKEERGVKDHYYVSWNSADAFVEWSVETGMAPDMHFKAAEHYGYGMNMVQKRQSAEDFLVKPYRELSEDILTALLSDMDKK